MSITGIGTRGALPDPLYMITIETLSEVEGGTFIPPKSAGAGWAESCLISKVTIGALELGAIRIPL